MTYPTCGRCDQDELDCQCPTDPLAAVPQTRAELEWAAGMLVATGRPDDVLRLIDGMMALARADERERCAKECEASARAARLRGLRLDVDSPDIGGGTFYAQANALRDVANVIRGLS